MLLESTILGGQPDGRAGAGLSEIKTNSAQVWLKFEFGLSLATELSKASFRWRAAEYYNRLPKIIRENEDLNLFKRDLKSWIRDNLSIY